MTEDICCGLPPLQLYKLIRAVQAHIIQVGIPAHFVSSEEILVWLENYEQAIVEAGIDVAAAWYKRQDVKPVDAAFCRYASGVMRNKDEARHRYERLETLAKMEEWEKLTPKQQAEYPGGFETFRSFEVQ